MNLELREKELMKQKEALPIEVELERKYKHWCEIYLYLKEKGLEVDFPETGFKWNELGLLDQKFNKYYEKEDFKMLIKKLDKTTKEILKIIESKSNVELYEMAWYDKWTMGKMIQLNTSSPFKNAKDRIRKWKKIKQLK
jgi:hypothetical protein